MKPVAISALVGVACLTAVAGVSAQDRRTTPSNSPADGQTLFVRECGICHLEGGIGTMMLARRLGEDKALLAQRSDLPPQYIEAVVRQGINSMPTITRVELPDGELQAIVGYLTRTSVKAPAPRATS